MKNCKNCNIALNDDALFCDKCGTAQPKQECAIQSPSQPDAETQSSAPPIQSQTKPSASVDVKSPKVYGTLAYVSSILIFVAYLFALIMAFSALDNALLINDNLLKLPLYLQNFMQALLPLIYVDCAFVVVSFVFAFLIWREARKTIDRKPNATKLFILTILMLAMLVARIGVTIDYVKISNQLADSLGQARTSVFLLSIAFIWQSVFLVILLFIAGKRVSNRTAKEKQSRNTRPEERRAYGNAAMIFSIVLVLLNVISFAISLAGMSSATFLSSDMEGFSAYQQTVVEKLIDLVYLEGVIIAATFVLSFMVMVEAKKRITQNPNPKKLMLLCIFLIGSLTAHILVIASSIETLNAAAKITGDPDVNLSSILIGFALRICFVVTIMIIGISAKKKLETPKQQGTSLPPLA